MTKAEMAEFVRLSGTDIKSLSYDEFARYCALLRLGQQTGFRARGGDMTDSREDNTRWVEVWLVNDAHHYFGARSLAHGDPSGEWLADYVTGVLKNAPHGTAAWHAAQEMSPADYNRVDWVEIVKTLTED